MNSREVAESNLQFAGFAAFACEIRVDTPTVISVLNTVAEIPCIMVTGDSALTALHVARETGIVRKNLPAMWLHVKKDEHTKSDIFEWVEVNSTGVTNKTVPFDLKTISTILSKNNLVVSGDVLPHDTKSPIWDAVIPNVCVFARMNPSQKEHVIAKIKSLGGKPLMCGDGGNDVGALKQADVGVALLAGFGAANTGKMHGLTFDFFCVSK